MHLVQILIPLLGPDGQPQPPELFRQTENELVERFSAVATFSRANPNDAAKPDAKAMAISEVMTDVLDQGWWSEYRTRLEERFRQSELVIKVSLVHG